MIEEIIRAEGWQFAYLGLVLACLWAAFRYGTDAMQKATVLLWLSWVGTNLFWNVQPIYLVADVLFGYWTYRLYQNNQEAPLLRISMLYGAMVYWHILHPDGWLYMAGLNLMFAWQCLVVLGACWRSPDGRTRGA